MKKAIIIPRAKADFISIFPEREDIAIEKTKRKGEEVFKVYLPPGEYEILTIKETVYFNDPEEPMADIDIRKDKYLVSDESVIRQPIYGHLEHTEMDGFEVHSVWKAIYNIPENIYSYYAKDYLELEYDEEDTLEISGEKAREKIEKEGINLKPENVEFETVLETKGYHVSMFNKEMQRELPRLLRLHGKYLPDWMVDDLKKWRPLEWLVASWTIEFTEEGHAWVDIETFFPDDPEIASYVKKENPNMVQVKPVQQGECAVVVKGFDFKTPIEIITGKTPEEIKEKLENWENRMEKEYGDDFAKECNHGNDKVISRVFVYDREGIKELEDMKLEALTIDSVIEWIRDETGFKEKKQKKQEPEQNSCMDLDFEIPF